VSTLKPAIMPIDSLSQELGQAQCGQVAKGWESGCDRPIVVKTDIVHAIGEEIEIDRSYRAQNRGNVFNRNLQRHEFDKRCHKRFASIVAD
jgi:hypothetical protein